MSYIVKLLQTVSIIIARNTARLIRNVYDRLKPEPIQSLRVKPWFKDEGDKTHRLNYQLNQNSLVFDLGGYEGEWAAQIFCKYNCFVYVFEPYEEYFYNIRLKFLHNQKVKVFNIGLSGKDEIAKLAILDDGSSVFQQSDKAVDISIKSISSFLKEHSVTSIDLMKINIEGGEYGLLEYLVQNEEIKSIKNIQVQFHDFVPEAEQRMRSIQTELAKTHELTYYYEFVWENWKLK